MPGAPIRVGQLEANRGPVARARDSAAITPRQLVIVRPGAPASCATLLGRRGLIVGRRGTNSAARGQLHFSSTTSASSASTLGVVRDQSPAKLWTVSFSAPAPIAVAARDGGAGTLATRTALAWSPPASEPSAMTVTRFESSLETPNTRIAMRWRASLSRRNAMIALAWRPRGSPEIVFAVQRGALDTWRASIPTTVRPVKAIAIAQTG